MGLCTLYTYLGTAGTCQADGAVQVDGPELIPVNMTLASNMTNVTVVITKVMVNSLSLVTRTSSKVSATNSAPFH
jgi:hypothetical protein